MRVTDGNMPIDIPITEHICAIDTGFQRPGVGTCYLIDGGSEIALIDTGVTTSAEHITHTLAARNLAPETVRWIILTHIHLDHAGGASHLLPHLPNCQVLVHPRGLPHLVDPRQLNVGVRMAFSVEIADTIFGTLLPIDDNRITSAEDGMSICVGQTELQIWHTPGHASHHQIVVDSASEIAFVGDAFGYAYPELAVDGLPFLIPATPPPEYDLAAMTRSIELVVRKARMTALGHYGAIECTEPLAQGLIARINLQQHAAMTADATPDAIGEAISDLYWREYLSSGGTLEQTSFRDIVAWDVKTNAHGLWAWRRQRR